MSKDDYDNELKKCFYNENLLKYKKLNDLAIKASREEEGYAKKREDSWKRFEEDNAFWLKPSKELVKEELDEKIDDFVKDIVDCRNEMINQSKKNKEAALKEIKEEPELVKVKIIEPVNIQCECGTILKRQDFLKRHQKTKKHENLMALKVLKEQMEKLSIETTKNPPVGPVKIKAPSLGGEISYIPVEKSRK